MTAAPAVAPAVAIPLSSEDDAGYAGDDYEPHFDETDYTYTYKYDYHYTYTYTY
jgi:hypothetical protein